MNKNILYNFIQSFFYSKKNKKNDKNIPKVLYACNTIGIIAPAGEVKDKESIQKAKEYFEKHGYKVILSKTCNDSHRYLAGETEEECINELHSFFENKEIKAIFCARGGFGTIKLIDKINWNIIKENPKIFVGYSDITAILNLMYTRAGLVTYHGPMMSGDFGHEINEYTHKRFFQRIGGLWGYIEAENPKVYYNGYYRGAILFGGNLTTLASLCGTDFIPNEDIILFLEDINEPVYKIDRALTQLLNIPEFKNRIKGIVLGEFTNVDNPDMLEELFKELANNLKVPMCGGFKITHGIEKETVPIGIKVHFDAEHGQIRFLEFP